MTLSTHPWTIGDVARVVQGPHVDTIGPVHSLYMDFEGDTVLEIIGQFGIVEVEADKVIPWEDQ